MKNISFLPVLILAFLNSITYSQPSNDNCAAAIRLTQSVSCIVTTGTTVNATESLPAITCNGYSGDANDDVWYKFTAASTDPTIVVRGVSPLDPVVDLHSDGCDGPTIACSDSTSTGGKEVIKAADLVIGNTYYIRIYGYGTGEDSEGIFSICVYGVPPPPPDNNDCVGAVVLVQDTLCNPVNGTTLYATQTLPAVECGGETGAADDDVWYKFTATYATTTIQVEGTSPLDPVIDLIPYACDWSSLACIDETASGGTETFRIKLDVGYTYFIRVYGFESGPLTQGPFTICVMGTPPGPDNDDCTDAILLTQRISCIASAGTTKFATPSIPAIACTDSAADADDDVWYKFKTRTASPTIVVTGEASFDPVIDLRSSGCPGVNKACMDSTGPGGTETLHASGLTPGLTYNIRVYSHGPGRISMGNYSICVFDVNTPSGIEDEDAVPGTVRVYPNPASDRVIVEFDLKTTENINLALYDQINRQVLEEEIKVIAGSFKKVLDTGPIPEGVYLVSLKGVDFIYNTRIVVVK
jgi:hypothetical protein